jgi:methylamine---glutamate N-methyltransferase subunit B
MGDRVVQTVDCNDKTIREINQAIRAEMASGTGEIRIVNPGARHNLGVGLIQPGRLIFEGSVGYYCGGMGDGPTIQVQGSAGWGLAEGMLNGTVVVERNAGNGAGAAIRGGTVVVRGDASARAGIAMKGGTVIVGGDAGYMTGFMMQKGAIIILGNSGAALGDSLYEGRIFIAGEIGELGNDAVPGELTADDRQFLADSLAPFGYQADQYEFKKIVAGRKLWNFDKKDFETWRVAL